MCMLEVEHFQHCLMSPSILWRYLFSHIYYKTIRFNGNKCFISLSD
jgi:hypothetical protein